MAGFMAGFGPAFAQSFNAETARSEDRKDDMFKLMYSDYIHRRDKYDDWQKEQSKQVNKAKALQDAYGQPDGSWPVIYNWINSGLDDSIISKRLTDGKLSVSTAGTPNTQSADSASTPTPEQSTSPASPDGQMVDSGLVKPGQNNIAKAPASAATSATPSPDANTDSTTTNATPNAAPSNPANINTPAASQTASAPAATGQPKPPTATTAQHKGLLSSLFPGFQGLSGNSGKSVDQRNSDAAINKISTISGQDPNTIRKVMSPGGMPQRPNMSVSGISYTPTNGDYAIDGMSQKELMQYNTVPELGMLVQQATAQNKPNLAAYAQHKLDLTRNYELQKQDALHGPTNQWFTLVKSTPDGNEFVRNVPGHMVRDNQGNATFVDAQGQPLEQNGLTAIPLDDNQRQDQLKLTQGQEAQAVRAYQSNTNRLASTVRLVGDMNKIVEADPTVLNFGGKIAEVGVSAVRDVVGSVNTLGQILQNSGVLTDKQILAKTGMTLDQLENKVDSLMGNAATNTASRAALFEAKKQLAAFQFASTQSQTGRNLSDKDYQRFLHMLESSTDPKTWQKTVADFINTEAQSLNEQAQQINNNPESIGFTKSYGYSMMPTVASSFDDFVNQSNDQALKDGYAFTKQYAGQAASPTYPENKDQGAQATPQQTPAQVKTTPPPDQAVQALIAHPELASQFDAKYGAGMAQRYLGNK